MSTAQFTVPTVAANPGNTDDLVEKITVQNLDFYYGDNRA